MWCVRAAGLAALALVLASPLASCRTTVKDIFEKQGFSYPVDVWWLSGDARVLRRGQRCTLDPKQRPLLERGRALLTRGALRRLAWRHCPPGADAALYYGPFVYIDRDERFFALELACLGTEQPAPGFEQALRLVNEDRDAFAVERLLDGWHFAPADGYWEARNVVLFRLQRAALEYAGLLWHFDPTEASYEVRSRPGYRRLLLQALDCALPRRLEQPTR